MQFIKKYPPSGDTQREHYAQANSSTWNKWKISDKMKDTREIMGVVFEEKTVPNFTFQVARCYPKNLKIKAAWMNACEVGQIGAPVMTTGTKKRT